MKISFWFLIFFLLYFSLAQAQESVKTHTVKKGETIYQIGRLYNVSPKEILKLNPNSGDVIEVNDIIILPPNNGLIGGANNNIYIVSKGDTKYGLSKKYGISIIELENQNPHIKNGLQIGQTIRVGNNINLEENTANLPESKNTNTLKTDKTHTIQKGETLYSISKMYNISVNELKNANPNIKQNDLVIGSRINIPKIDESQVTNIVSQETKTDTKTSEPKQAASNILIDNSSGGYTDLRLSVDKTRTTNILFLSPFTEEEFISYEESSISFDIIIDSLLKRDLEFYRGAQIAIDSLKSLGLNININQFKIESKNRDKKSNINTELGTLEDIDVVIAPFYKNEIDWVTSLAFDKNIPVIYGYAASSNSYLTNIYEGLPSVDYQKLIMLEYLDSNESTISVIIDSDRIESKQFILKNKPSAVIIETDSKGNYAKKDLISAFSKSKINYVIIDSEKIGVYLRTTNLLLRELSNYNIQLVVLESSLIPNSNDISPKRFKILKLLYPEIGKISNTPTTAKFFKNYKEKFGIEPSENVLFGFDLTFDSLLRTLQEKNFEESIKMDKTVYLKLKFNYIKNEKNRYINNEIRIVEYANEPINNDED